MPSNPNLPNGYAGLFILLAFLGAMVWIVWLGIRRQQFGGASEVSAADQSLLGQEARATYLDPRWGLCNPETPSEFDSHVLSLFDSIERNGDDIDARLENLRVYMKTGDMWQRLKYKQKLNIVYRNVAAHLVRPRSGRPRMAMQQLLASWGKVGSLAGSGPSRLPDSWIRPLTNDFAVQLASLGGGESPLNSPSSTPSNSRGFADTGPVRQALVGALFFSVFGTMIVYGVRRDAPPLTLVEWAVGIFLAVLLAYRVGLIRHTR